MENTELTHHGILGMKWGVRRYQNKNGTLTAAGKKRYSDSDADRQVKAQRKSEAKKRRTMTDDELRQKVARLQLENQYKDLVDVDVAPGRKFVSEVMGAAGKKALTVAAAGAIAYGIKVAMTKEGSVKEAASYIAANPNKKK